MKFELDRRNRLFPKTGGFLTITKSLAIAILIIPAIIASALAQTGSDTLRIEQAVRDAINHNDRAAAARYMEESAKDKIGPAGAWDDPMLMLGVANLPTSFDFKMDPMTMKMIGISQNIPYAGQKGLAKKAARADVDVSTEERRGVESQLAVAAKQAFYDLYYRGQILNELQRQREIFQQIVDVTTAKLKANEAGQEDLLAAQAELGRFESEILSAQQGLDEARFNLNALRGTEVNSPLPVPAEPSVPAIPEKADEWLIAALGNYPELRQANARSQSYEFSAAAARRMRWPMLGLSANYNIREQGSLDMGPRDNMVGFQATLSLPIFSGRQQGKMARSMEAMSRSADAEANQMRRDMEAQLRTTHQRAMRLTENLRLYHERIIPTSEDAFRAAFAGYASNRTLLATLLNYALTLSRDRITEYQISNDLGRTLAEAERFTTDFDSTTSSDRK